MSLYQVDFQPLGRRGECSTGQSLLDCARELSVQLVSLCGGEGTCGCCKVQILSGHVSPPAPGEREVLSPREIEEGYRLACQSYPSGPCQIWVPPESLTTSQRVQVEGLSAVTVSPEPAVSAYRLKLSPPSLSEPEMKADAERLLEALARQQTPCRSIDVDALRGLPSQVRSWDWEVQASVRGDEVIAFGPWPSRQLGLAVDLGTTKIAGYLMDLSDGQTLASQGIMNPQIAYGEDVITRIACASKSPAEAGRLQRIVVDALNELAAGICAGVGATPQDIVEAVVVGNTAMHHLFLRLPVEQLAVSPYVAAVQGSLEVKARYVGLKLAAGAYVHLLPGIAGFVGADHVAMLLATGAWRAEGTTLALDIGTNTEVCLVSNGRPARRRAVRPAGRMTAVSCASGPAFEGGHIKHGMRAASGAIEHLRLVGDRIEYQTIGDAPPVGLCGSGILDAVAQLYLAGVISAGGRMGTGHPRVRVSQGEREFILVDEEDNPRGLAITVTQRDVREVQLAKAAMRTGIQLLLEMHGCCEEDITEVLIAGAFGSYIGVSSAVTIGMLPPLPPERFRQVGNAAGMGAKLALISGRHRAEAQAIAGKVGYAELAAHPHFEHTFAQANYIGRYWMRYGKREVIV
ncbi:MAG: DUF4445 domain-containing protein [Chloroflexi bacterium]|nr:DUF4445 domain-containing protein [Chloroflexota bacterium]